MLQKLARGLFSFRGRMTRAELWGLMIVGASAFVAALLALEATFGGTVSLALYPPLFWIVAALGTKRLHDRGRSAWWWLAILIPILGPLFLLCDIAFLRGSPGDNQYGADPLETNYDYLTVK